MPDLTPLTGVDVEVVSANATRETDADGVALFEGVPAGPTRVFARKAAHRTALS